MFRGINAINIDVKGRMAMPTRYRDRLASEANDQLVVTIDTEARCLLLYPLGEWELIEEKLASLPSFNPASRRIQRLLIGHATEVELDANGRILLAPLLRDYAGLTKKVVLIGQGKKFEIWDETKWNSNREAWLEKDSGGNRLPPDLETLSL